MSQYKKIRNKTPEEYFQIFQDIYCDFTKPIYTFDNIKVKFFPEKFYHSFYESYNWQEKDKSLFSYNRAEKILWIKDALEDPASILRVGWVKKTKSYDYSRRVAIVKNDYAVVIWMQTEKQAKFVTAYHAYDSIESILSGPAWLGFKK